MQADDKLDDMNSTCLPWRGFLHLYASDHHGFHLQTLDYMGIKGTENDNY